MLSIITSRTREVLTRRPRGPLVVNWASPQMRGLVAWYPAHPFALDTGNNWKSSINTQFSLTNTNAVPVGVNQDAGQVFQFAAASSHHFKLTSAVLSTVPMTFACWFIADATATHGLMGIYNSAAGQTRQSWQLLAFGTGAFVIGVAACDSNSFDGANSTTLWRAGELTHACGVYLSDTSRSAFCNGTGKNSNTTSSIPASVNRTIIGGRLNTDAYATGLNGAVADARIYNRALSDDAVYALYDPETRWELYYPIGRVSYFFNVLAGGAFTLDAAVGSYTISGTTAGLLAARKVDATSGSYAITGSTATLQALRQITATAGSYAISGQDIGLLRSILLDAQSGSYNLSGTVTSLLKGTVMAAESGVYALTGQAVGFLRGLVVDAQSGSYAISGTDAGLLRSILLDAESGTYSLSGSNVTLVYTPVGAYVLVANGGTYAVSGSVAALLKGSLVAASSGSYTLTGQDIGFLVDHVLSASAGSYDITGTAVSLLRSLLLTAESGAYSISGTAVTLIYTPVGAFVLTAEGGVYAVSGSDVALKSARVISAASGSYSLSGDAATIAALRKIVADGGTYLLSGTDIQTLLDRVLAAGSGSYAISGAAVSLLYSAGGIPIAITFEDESLVGPSLQTETFIGPSFQTETLIGAAFTDESMY